MPRKSFKTKPLRASRDNGGNAPSRKSGSQLTIQDLGWTRQQAREVRAKLSAFAADWDDPKMDIYNEP